MDKNSKRKAKRPMKDVVETDTLVGDGRAKVSRNFFLHVKGGEYNDITVGASATVTLSCNQDDKTINSALDTAESLSQKAIKRYHPYMEKVVKQLLDEKDY